MTFDDWIDAYRRAWQDRDPDAAAALFTDDATYRSALFAEPHRGQDGVRRYWAEATATQSRVVVRTGRPFGAGERVPVEFWSTLLDGGAETTIIGCLLLRFAADGRCAALCEVYLVEPRGGGADRRLGRVPAVAAPTNRWASAAMRRPVRASARSSRAW